MPHRRWAQSHWAGRIHKRRRNIHTLGHHVKSPPQSGGTVHQITLGFHTASLDPGSSAAEWTREWTSGDA
jgi:hypothetical protein